MRMLMITAIFGAAVTTAIAAPPFGDGFATGKIGDYLESVPANQTKIVLKSVPGMTGKLCLSVADNTTAQFKMAAVDPKTKYTLTFRGRCDGGETIEENPRLDIATMPGRNLPILPWREIKFFDAEKKLLSFGLRSGMPFRQWQVTRDTFYPPAKAAFVQLTVHGAAGITFYMDNVNLDKTPDEGAININPEFKYGPYDYSGWAGIAAGGKLIQLDDGRTAFDTKYGSSTANFPVSEPGTYTLSAKMTANGYNANVGLLFYDENGKQVGSAGLRGRAITHFLLPPGTTQARFLIYSSVVEELRLIRAGDENKIHELLKN